MKVRRQREPDDGRDHPYDDEAGPWRGHRPARRGETEAEPVTEHHSPLGVPDPHRSDAWWEVWLDRFGPPGTITREIPLAVAVTLLTAALLAFTFGYAYPVQGEPLDPVLAWVVGSVACLQSLVLVLRRRYPLACFAAVVLIQLLLVLVPDFTIRGPALVVAGYTLGTLWSIRRTQLAVGLAVLTEVLLTVTVAPPAAADRLLGTVSSALGAVATYGIPALAGAAMATRRRYTELLAERAADAVAAQRATVQAALTAERTRMARELHDVAAHHLSGMVVQAAAVERLVERDPAAARAGAAWIRTQGRKTLDNLRLTVGVLREASGPREGEGEAERTPTPGLAQLDELVGTARELGTSVDLVRRGVRYELPPIADIACFRVVQEALSNARQHAAGAAVSILLDFQPGALLLEVVDSGSTHPGRPRRVGTGVGLVGMQERAELIGAEFDAGPVAGGGWRVRLHVPVAAIDQLPGWTPDRGTSS